MSTYTLLIVDDESFVVDWIFNLLETNLAGDITLYKAYTPAKALEIVNTTRIDLLISDINMPDIDGLTVVLETTRIWPMCKAILLTGHPIFEYAHQAIQLGVMGYILKTSGDAEILTEVRKALDAVEDEIKQQYKLISLQQALDENVMQLKRQVFFTWIRGNYLSYDELTQCRNLLGFSDNNEPYYIIVCSVSNPDETKSKLWESLAVYRLIAIINHYLDPYVSQMAVEANESRMIWILQPHLDFIQNKSYENILVGALEMAQKAVSSTVGSSTSFCISSAVQNAAELPEQYLLVKIAIENMNSEETVVRLSVRKGYDKQESNGLNLQRQNSLSLLKHHLSSGNEKACLETIHQIFSSSFFTLNWHDIQTLEVYFNIFSMMLYYISQNSLDDAMAIKSLVHRLARPWNFVSSESVEEEMGSLLHTIFEEKSKKKSLDAETITEQVKAYINTHIETDIFLMDLAEQFGYSTNYISRIFSKYTGTTISEYIAERKMTRIRELLQNESTTIADVAKATGFNSRTYFNTFIKRHTGMSPSEFRSSTESRPEETR